MRQLFKHFILFIIGGILYFIIELLWRQYSHISMFILGGICFVLIGFINEYYTFKMSLLKQQLIATIIITILEFITGLIVNIWLGLNVWNYSHLPLNIMGQICVIYSIFWFFLSIPAIIIDDYLRYWFFNEEKPHYKLI